MRNAFLGLCVLVTLLIAPSAWADDFLPDSPPLCEATFGDAGGEDADFDITTNTALSFADGGAAQEDSSHASIGLTFRPAMSFPATVEMGVTYSGLLVGSLGINTIYGSVKITATLRDLDENVDLASEVLLDLKQDGEAFGTIFDVISAFPDPPVATFENVELIGQHEYAVILEVVTKAKGLQGESDFKTGDRGVRFSCVSITAELEDSDGDGLYDLWEESGIDVDDDGVVDVDLPAFGAQPDHKDLFIEMDWRPGQQPTVAQIQAMKDAFDLAPVDAGGTPNPDGQPGINLWVDTGGLLQNGQPVGDDFGGGGDVIPDPVICLDDSFYEAKAQFFDPARLVAFRYLISGIPGPENTCANGVQPSGKAEIGGNDFVVYSGQAGVAFHELGHTLHLRHGGFENLNNKPNYVSMMNYNYGFSIPQVSGGSGLLDYSPPLCPACPGGRGAIPAPLDENDLDETMVLDPNDDENMFQYRDLLALSPFWRMSGQDTDGDAVPDVDWDGDGAIADPPPVDINEDGKCVEPGDGVMDSDPEGDDVLLSDNIIHDGPNRRCDTTAEAMDVQKGDVGEEQPNPLIGHDDWSAIKLNFRPFGDSADHAVNPPSEPDRTLEEYEETEEELNTTDLEILKSDLPDPVNAGEPLVYSITVANHGPQPARGIRVTDTLPAEATYVSDTGGCTEAPAGTLTCELATVLQGDSRSFEITVVFDPDDVADLPAPAIVENNVSVENKVPYGHDGSLGEIGGDPEPSNNEDSEQTVVNRPPVSDPNGPYVEECEGETTAVQLDGSASFDPDGDPITFEWTTDCPGGVFDDSTSETPILTVTSPPPCPVVCSATLKVTDPGNLSDTESASVTIEDTTPPAITVELTPATLWPASHNLVEITATVVASDICDPFPEVELTSIVSDEPDDAPGNGDGHTVGDIQGAALGTADFQFKLRAERAGTGDGRTYTVTYTVTDECGLSTEAEAEVFVPHDQQSQSGLPVDVDVSASSSRSTRAHRNVHSLSRPLG